jgi:hypothetical protein
LVVEGQADFELLNGLSYYYSEDEGKRNLSLMRNDIVLTYAESKSNFPKFKAIFDDMRIKYYFIGDSDAENNSIENVAEIFDSPSYITESNIIFNNGKKNIFVIKDGNLETLMEKIDKHAYCKAKDQIRKYGKGKNKPLLAKFWLEFAYHDDKNKLKVFEDLFSLITSYSVN